MRLYQLCRNANVVHLDSAYILFSYNEAIAMYNDDDTLFLVKNWDKFSQSTNKHTYEFLRQYTAYKTIRTKKEVESLIKNNSIKIVDSL